MENKKTKITVIMLEIAIAIIFVSGSLISRQSQAIRIFYEYYFADILIPFCFYFLLIPIQSERKYSKIAEIMVYQGNINLSVMCIP